MFAFFGKFTVFVFVLVNFVFVLLFVVITFVFVFVNFVFVLLFVVITFVCLPFFGKFTVFVFVLVNFVFVCFLFLPPRSAILYRLTHGKSSSYFSYFVTNTPNQGSEPHVTNRVVDYEIVSHVS